MTSSPDPELQEMFRLLAARQPLARVIGRVVPKVCASCCMMQALPGICGACRTWFTPREW